VEYRPFGRTGVRVSALGFGGGPAGVPDYLVPWDSASAGAQSSVENAVRRALEGGVTYFDTAPLYGAGISESLLGRALGADRSRIFLATKTPRADWTPSGIRRSLEESLRRLRTDYVDLLQYHGNWYSDEEALLILEHGGIEAFERLKAEGKVRFLGFTAEGQNGAVDRLIASGRFDAMMITYNLIYQGGGAWRNGVNPPQSALSLARSRSMGTAAMRTLTSAVFQRWVSQIAPGLAGQVDWGGALLGFSLSHPQVDVAVVGMRSVDEVDRNVAVVENGSYRVDLASLHSEGATR
jgi:uncharacterized protein